MPICNRNLREKDIVTCCAPTNSPSPIRALGQSLIFGFETIRTIGTCMQLVTTQSTNFSELLKKSDNWDPLNILTILFTNADLKIHFNYDTCPARSSILSNLMVQDMTNYAISDAKMTRILIITVIAAITLNIFKYLK